MNVTVRLFAMLREGAGKSSVELDLSDGATVHEAIALVGREQGIEELIDRMPVVAAVNREYVPDEQVLSDGDELALIPPVSGGAEGERTEAGTAPLDGAEFRTGEGYEDFMALVGNHVPRPPAYTELIGTRPLHAEPGHVRLEFTATEQFLNPAGVVQGGFLAVMLDEAMGPAAISALGPGLTVPTLELKVNFLRPARPGRLVADARVVHRGKSVVFMESSLSDDDGVLIATATATARIVPIDGSSKRSAS